ncbi:hypothetical protein ABPG77_006167 [Micractinium sp. CCAP 211/92]
MQVADGLLPSGPPFWEQPVPELDSFLNSMLTGDTISLDACLVPAPLAASFGLSTDSSLSSYPRAAAVLGTAGSGGGAAGLGGDVSARGAGGGSGGPQQPRRAQQQPGQAPSRAGVQQVTQAVPQAATIATTVGLDSVPLVPQMPPAGEEPPMPMLAVPSMQQQQPQQPSAQAILQQQQQQQAARAARGTRRETAGDLTGQQPQVESGLPAALQQGSGMRPASFSGLLADQQAAATAALIAAPGGAAVATVAGTAAGGTSDRPYSSQDPQQQDAVPHLRYDFAQAQQDQAAVVAQFAQEQQQQQQHAAAMFAQQQAYQQQQQAAAAAYQQQQAAAAAAFQQQAQQTQPQGGAAAAGGSAGGPAGAASAAAFFQRQQQAAAAAAAFSPFPNPYGGGGWPMYPQYGGQYGQFGGQYGGYYPYGMQYPGMQFPGMQQGTGGGAGLAGLLPLPTPGGSNIGGSVMPSPPQPQQLHPQEVVQQSDGAAHGDDDPCAIKKARLIWTPALHRRFLESVEKVGGVDRALPKAVMKEMGVAGLTRENVASHLQKHRMRLKREEEEEGGGDAPSGHPPAPGSARAAPRARNDAPADHAAAGDDEMADVPHESPAGPPGLEHGGAAAAAERRNRRPRRAAAAAGLATALMPAPSELSDGRTAEGAAV